MFEDNYDVKVYMKEELICDITVRNGVVSFKNYIDMAVFLPFGISKTATMQDLEEFYEERCFPRERANCKELLHDLGVGCYDPEAICRITHGLQFDDFIWLQFSDEPQVCWNDIKMRD